MPRKNSAKQPIGKGKAGSMKRMLYKEGMGKKALATWRSSNPDVKQANKAVAKSQGAKFVISQMRARRVAAGKNPTTGVARTKKSAPQGRTSRLKGGR